MLAAPVSTGISFLVVTSGTSIVRDLDWLRRRASADARVVWTDATDNFAVLSVMGPRSREFLATLTDADLSNAAFPFGTS